MRVNTDQRRRDWSIIIFILPLGLVMMMCVGQLAVRMSPNWSVSGEMNSSLDPETAPKQDALIVPPISSDILTPMSWWDTFLTPSGGGVVFPPFITFEPSLTPTATATPWATTASPTASPTGVTTTPTPPTSTPTKKPTDDDTTPNPPTVTATTTTVTATATTATTTITATATTPAPINCTDPNALNNGGPLPCTYPVPVSSTPAGLPSATPTGVTDPPNGDTAGNNVINIPDGYYVIITLPTPIVVVGISDTGYDLVYYERQLDDSGMPSGYGVHMDQVILSISTAVNGTYYQIFNWGDGIPDTNSNLGDVAGLENDNQPIDASEFYGTYPQDTGILIDVDNAPSYPPPGNYSFLAIQAPTPLPANDGADVDAVEVVDIPFVP